MRRRGVQTEEGWEEVREIGRDEGRKDRKRCDGRVVGRNDQWLSGSGRER